MEAVQRLAIKGRTPKEIERELRVDEGIAGLDVPTLRTIQRMVADITPDDPTGPWTLADAAGEDAEKILPGLREAIELGKTLTKQEAEWVLKISLAAPEIDSAELYRLARVYRWRLHVGMPIDDLDAYLAYRPWMGREEREAWRAALEARDVVLRGSMLWTAEDWDKASSQSDASRRQEGSTR